jgi:hypothetical protein
MSFPSSCYLKTGDVDVGRSQLGVGWSGNPVSNFLWGNYNAANRYCFTIFTDTIMRLPVVGTSVNEAQPGYWVTIANDNTSASPYILDVYEFTGITKLATLYPGCSACFIANTAVPNNWTVMYSTSDYVRAQLRAGVDPTSNPDPLIGGLLIPAGTTEFNMPITISPQSIGLADPFITDNSGFFQVDPDGVNIMFANDYQVSFNIYIIGFGAAQNQLQAGQILVDGQSIFSAPPVCSASDYSGSVITTPLVGVIWLLTGTANFQTTTPVKIVMRLLMNGATDLVVALTSNLSLEKI